MDDTTLLERFRAICTALPEVTERLTHGEPGWFVRDKKLFAMYNTHHHGDPHEGFWCAAPAGAQEVLTDADPDRFYRPPYVGHRGWVGVNLDVEPVDWDMIATIAEEAYRAIAPAKLAALIGANRAT